MSLMEHIATELAKYPGVEDAEMLQADDIGVSLSDNSVYVVLIDHYDAADLPAASYQFEPVFNKPKAITNQETLTDAVLHTIKDHGATEIFMDDENEIRFVYGEDVKVIRVRGE